MHSRPYFSDAVNIVPPFRPNSVLDLQDAMSLPGLGLPGLGLEEPAEQSQTVEATRHELSSGSEWRFEVAFGKFVKVRVSITITFLLPLFYDVDRLIDRVATHRHSRDFWERAY
jgi:hypothetical protein